MGATGNCRHEYPVRITYRILSTTCRRGCFRTLPGSLVNGNNSSMTVSMQTAVVICSLVFVVGTAAQNFVIIDLESVHGGWRGVRRRTPSRRHPVSSSASVLSAACISWETPSGCLPSRACLSLLGRDTRQRDAGSRRGRHSARGLRGHKRPIRYGRTAALARRRRWSGAPRADPACITCGVPDSVGPRRRRTRSCTSRPSPRVAATRSSAPCWGPCRIRERTLAPDLT
ncbi:hypothetical protein BDK92_6189 [Micromonospora pisi]|uniref:Uncharacterized protein n=1 Tax=Micromonospora pisi TaxID=589240 RepID=A0A495JSE6_9ACTN|nr:hypothetical protein BDK92_6189 [Micromonospora pisi]